MKKTAALLVVVAVVVAAPAAQAQMGVGVMWVESGIHPSLVLPIKMGEDMVFQPRVFFRNQENYGTEIDFGASIEKHMNPGGTSGLFGVMVEVDIWSPDEGDSRTDFGGGIFVGGTAELTDDMSIVGQMGLDLFIIGDDGPTTIGTHAMVTFRWWVFGNN